MQVEAGTPLRLYLTRKVSYRFGAPVLAKFAYPVWAFDRIVIPEGSIAKGQVADLEPVSRFVRASAMVNGNFTPFKHAQVLFTSVTLPDGREMKVDTEQSLGLATIFTPGRPQKSKKPKSSDQGQSNPSQANSTQANPNQTKMAAASHLLRQQAINQANARSRGLFDLVRGPNKREWLENFLLNKLPYRPQWYRTGTRFDATLKQPLDFGTVSFAHQDLQAMGSQPSPDAVVEMRIVSDVSSEDARVGDPMEGVLTAPLFAANHQLILPEATRISGKVTLVQPARMFHRGGKLRFAIDQLQVPQLTPQLASNLDNSQGELKPAAEPVRAQLAAVEADPKKVQVDEEGTAKATESKTRLIRPVIAGLVAAKSLDNDTGKQTASGTPGPASANTSGLSLGGFSGFGLLGIAAAQGPREVGSALGFYGFAWSVYSNVISRGTQVRFEKNSAVAIRFGTPPRKQ